MDQHNSRPFKTNYSNLDIKPLCFTINCSSYSSTFSTCSSYSSTPPPSSEPEPDFNDISDQPDEISNDQTVNIDDTNDDDMVQSVECNTDNDVYHADDDGPKMHPLPNNVLNASELYSIVTSNKPTFTSITMGQKSNCYMLLDNSTNVERKKSNKKSHFSDDLRSWNSDSGTTVNTHYVISHDFKCAYMKNGLYCFPKKVNNKRTFVPISPQPAESDVVTLHRYYTTLKRQPDLKKRVTWFSNPGNQDLSTRAIVEYISVVKQFPWQFQKGQRILQKNPS